MGGHATKKLNNKKKILEEKSDGQHLKFCIIYLSQIFCNLTDKKVQNLNRK